MTPEQREAVLKLVVRPGGPEPISRDELLRRFGVTDGVGLAVSLLRDASERCDETDVELALVVGFVFGFTDDHVPLLVDLAFADWHRAHEDVVSALAEISSPAAVDALAHSARWVPEYLEFDDARALGVKAVWALGGIRSEAATHALQVLSRSESPVVSENAQRHLERRQR